MMCIALAAPIVIVALITQTALKLKKTFVISTSKFNIKSSMDLRSKYNMIHSRHGRNHWCNFVDDTRRDAHPRVHTTRCIGRGTRIKKGRHICYI